MGRSRKRYTPMNLADQALMNVMDDLTLDEAICLWLILVKEQSHAFVAELLGESRTYVGRTYRSAIAKIRQEFIALQEQEG